ncbi:MAG: hypothetical protein R3E10_00745 [Gemmatimonadota bacterium]
MSPDTTPVTHAVDAVRRHLRGRLRLAAGVWGGSVLAALLLAAWLAVGSGWRVGSLWPLVLDGLLLLAALMGVLALRRLGGGLLEEARVAAAVEDSAALRRGTVLGSLELERAVPPGTSGVLARQATLEAARGLVGHSAGALSGEVGSRVSGVARRGLALLGVLVPVLVVLLAWTPARTLQAWRGLARPVHAYLGGDYPPLEVTPGSVEILRGSPILVRVRAPGRAEATLRWVVRGNVPQELTLPLEDDEAGFPFERVDSEIEYWAETPDGARSERFVLSPVNPLLVTDLTLQLAFPDHTGLPPEELREPFPVAILPVGTRVRIVGRASRPLAEAVLEFPGAPEAGVELTPAGSAFEGEWFPTRSGTYQWRFRDPDGEIPEIQPSPLDVVLLRDSLPSLRVVFPGVDTVMPISHKQPLVVEARDDYGLSHVAVVAVQAGAGLAARSTTQRLELDGSRDVVARPLLDLSEWKLLPGDSVRYRVRAVDNAPSAQSTESDEYLLRVPGLSELRRNAGEELDSLAERLARIAEQAAEQAEDTRDLEQTSEQRQGGRLGFDEREQMRETAEQQEGVNDQLETMQNELEELSEQLREAGLADPELRKDMEELQALLESLLTDEMRERLQELSNSVDQAEAAQAREELSQLAEQQEEMRDRLEEALDRFRRAAVEQDFRATTEEVRELAEQERALADALREGDNPELRERQQEELANDADALKDRMETLRERLEQLGEDRAGERVDQAAEQLERARQAMDRARQQAQQSPQQAGQSADQAAQALEEGMSELEEAQRQMAAEIMERIMEALDRAADDALELAERESELRRQMRGADAEAREELLREQASINEGVRNLERSLSEAMQVNPAEGNPLGERAEEARKRTEQASDALEGRDDAPTSAAAAAEGAVDALNRLALAAMATSEQMSQSGQQQMSGEQVMEQLEQLAEQQSELLNQSEQTMPMQLGEQAMQNQMQQMAEGQESVASELGELADEPGADDQALGDLEALAEEARAIAQLLQEGRLDREVMERQQELFHRLLDAGRSLEKEEEEETEERESTTAGSYERRDVVPLSPELLRGPRFPLPSAEVLERLTPAERQLVRRYFERLNRGGRGNP